MLNSNEPIVNSKVYSLKYKNSSIFSVRMNQNVPYYVLKTIKVPLKL